MEVPAAFPDSVAARTEGFEKLHGGTLDDLSTAVPQGVDLRLHAQHKGFAILKGGVQQVTQLHIDVPCRHGFRALRFSLTCRISIRLAHAGHRPAPRLWASKGHKKHP